MTEFVDTSALMAFMSSDDDHHERAVSRWPTLDDPITHNYVVVETISLLQRRLGMAAVRGFVGTVLPAVDMHWVEPTEHAGGVRAMVDSSKRSVSLVDYVSFSFMRRHGVTTAFAYDDDFRRQGFRVVR